VNAARDQVLARIRAANAAAAGAAAADGNRPASAVAGAPGGDVDSAYAGLPRDYRRAHHDPASTDIVALFAERAADYRAVVERAAMRDVPAAVARVLVAAAASGRKRFVVPEGLPPEWLAAMPADVELTGDDPPLPVAELDDLAGVVTGCAVAIAETGTIILDHGPAQGRRALTLVPDFHLVIVRSDQVAADLPDAFAHLDPARPHTLISGPSATSDIELIRVEGVHGPRNLHILLADTRG
jgi:L-lactate dehydrogenase complex protein LldG